MEFSSQPPFPCNLDRPEANSGAHAYNPAAGSGKPLPGRISDHNSNIADALFLIFAFFLFFFFFFFFLSLVLEKPLIPSLLL